MNIVIYILCGFTVLDILLTSISYAKQSKTFNIITALSLFPILSILSILLMIQKYPDSLKTIIITGITTIFSTLSLLYLFIDNKKTQILSKISFSITSLTWTTLFSTILFIHKIPTSFNIIVLILYFLLIAASVYFIGKQKLHIHLIKTFFIIIAILLNYFGLIFICYERTLASVVLFMGTTGNLLLAVNMAANFPKIDLKKEKLLRFIIMIASQTLIAYSNVILFA